MHYDDDDDDDDILMMAVVLLVHGTPTIGLPLELPAPNTYLDPSRNQPSRSVIRGRELRGVCEEGTRPRALSVTALPGGS